MDELTELSKLEGYQKRFVVRCNAFLTNPSLTQGYFETIYGQKISMDLILRMNPATPDLCILDEDLIEYWNGVRQLAVDSLKAIPIADFLVRLQVFSELYEILRKQGSYDLIIELLEVVAAETDRIYHTHYENLNRQNMGFKFPTEFEA